MTLCPHCGAPLVSLSSQNLKLCPDCKGQYPWPLKPEQRPIVNSQRGDKRQRADPTDGGVEWLGDSNRAIHQQVYGK